MKKSEYRAIIKQLTDLNKDLTEQNEALKRTCKANKRTRLRIIASLYDLSNQLGAECMIPETEVVEKCVEAVKKAYV